MIACSKLLMYYFSGTGNAKRVSAWISELADEKQVPAELLDISKIDRKKIPRPPLNALIGFCSPTHGFNYPSVMMYFIFRFPRANHNNVFLMNTRAGVKIFNIALPGLSGAALLLSAIVLICKGYKVVGMRSIDLPSNWISLHPALRRKAIDWLFIRFRKVTRNFAGQILEGKHNYRALLSLPVDLAITPISFLYFFFGRFFFAKSFYATRDCDNCMLCIKQCPVKAISLVDDKPYWSYKCESCMHCMNSCPRRAIETAHGYIIGLLILLNTIMQSTVYTFFIHHNILWFSKETGYGGLAWLVLENIVFFGSLFISYWVVHYLRRIKTFDVLITYTSLTFYKFWGRYKPNKIQADE
jgi:Pyruvate/2-oxoacid:ferredoxin oxidoreductase delta subunit